MSKRKLPLEDPRWLQLLDADLQRRRQVGSDTLAAADLVPLIEDGRVRSKLEALDYSTRPPARVRRMLTPEDFQRDFRIVRLGRGLGLDSRRGPPLRPLVAYIWSPDLKNFFGTDAASSQPQSLTAEVPVKRGRKPVHDRAELQSVALWLATQRKHGAPPKNATVVVDELRAWCVRHKRKVPVDSTLYEIVTAAFRTKPLLRP